MLIEFYRNLVSLRPGPKPNEKKLDFSVPSSFDFGPWPYWHDLTRNGKSLFFQISENPIYL